MRAAARLALLLLGAAGTGALAAPATALPADAYQDRVLDGSPQPPPSPDDAGADGGWPRAVRIEAQALRQGGAYRAANQSLQMSGYLDTPRHGSLSAQFNLQRDGAPQYGYAVLDGLGQPTVAVPLQWREGSTWRLDQRGMPFDGGWYGHAALGHIQLAAAPLARGLGRVVLPALPVEGAAYTLEQPGQASVNLSAGRLGLFNGIGSQGFIGSGGHVASAGGQRRWEVGDSHGDGGGAGGGARAARIDAAAQFIDARGLRLNGPDSPAQDIRALWAALAWEGAAPWAQGLGGPGHGFGGLGERVGGLRVQANLARSDTRGAAGASPAAGPTPAARGPAHGLWVDAGWRDEWLRHGATVFHFDPGLRWGADGLPSDLRGVAWRGDMASRQWQAGAQLELSDSVSGRTAGTGPSAFGSVFGRYRFDSRDALAGTLSARGGSHAAQSAQVQWEHQGRWGQTQWRADAARAGELHTVRGGVDHTWRVGEQQTLATSLALAQTRQGGRSQRQWLWGVLGATPLPGGARLDLSLRGGHAFGHAAGDGWGDGSSDGFGGAGSARFLSAHARLAWTLGAGWSFIAQYSASRGHEAIDPAVVSALASAVQAPRLVTPANRSLLLALRFEDRAGRATAPLGGAPGVGAGRLEGYVYFDANRSARREASEGGVPGIGLLLDGRHVATTDAQGFYSFPLVAAGPHQLELVQDALPLPWSSPAGTQRTRIDVMVRDTARADFPVQQER